MRILIAIDTLGGGGGTERWTVYMLPELLARGHSIEVAALFPPYDLGPQLEAIGIPVHRLGLKHRWSVAEGALKLAWLIQRRGPFDVVHGRLFFAGAYVAASRALSPGPARVVSFHNLVYDYPNTTLITEVRKAWEGWLLRRQIDGYAAISSAVAAHYQKHLGVSGVEVIHNALPPDAIKARAGLDRNAVLNKYGSDPSAFVIAVAARQVHEKGHRFLIEAVERLRDRQLRPQVIMMGGGPLSATTRQQIDARRLGDQILLLDRDLPHAEVIEVLTAADASVLPSTFEGFGYAAAEAMAVGRPLIASRVGGLVDLVEDEQSGLLVAPADPMALAQAIERLMVDGALRDRLGRAGRLRVEQHFGVPAIATKWEQFYSRAREGI